MACSVVMEIAHAHVIGRSPVFRQSRWVAPFESWRKKEGLHFLPVFSERIIGGILDRLYQLALGHCFMILLRDLYGASAFVHIESFLQSNSDPVILNRAEYASSVG